MGLFKNSDEKFLERLEKEEKDMLSKLYDLKKTDNNCPSNPYLLYPKNLYLTSYKILPQNIIQLNIGYKKNWSGYVTKTMRMNYTQTILGSIYCEEVESCKEVDYKKTGTIKTSFMSKSKTLNIPVQDGFNIEIKCKKIRVKSLNIYVESEGGLIPQEEYLESLQSLSR